MPPAKPVDGTGSVRRLRVTCPPHVVDVIVEAAAAASVGDVMGEITRIGDLALPTGSQWSCDGLPLSLESRWSATAPVDGATIGSGPSGVRPAVRAASELAVVAGLHAGTRLALPTGQVTVGRGSAATVRVDDPEMSRMHFTLRRDGESIQISDAGSTNGTRVDGQLIAGWVTLTDGSIVRAGTSVLAMRAVASRDADMRRRPGDVQAVVNRAPRRDARLGSTTLTAPSPPTSGRTPRLLWPAMAMPLVGGVAIALVTHRPQFLLFSLLSPLIVAGNYLSDRVTHRKAGRISDRDYREALIAHNRDVAQSLTSEAAMRRSSMPDAASIHATATTPTAQLWHRGTNDTDFLHVRIGVADQPSRAVTVKDSRGSVVDASVLPDLPVVVDLRSAMVTGIAGDELVRDAMSAALLAQLATLHSPTDVRLAVMTSAARLSAWDWMKWLPHVGGGQHPAVGVAEDEFGAIVDAAINSVAAAVVVVDAVAGILQSPQVRRLLDGTAGSRMAVVVLAERTSALPHQCGCVVDASKSPTSALVTTKGSTDVAGVLVDRMDAACADEIARHLAGYREAQGSLAEAAALPTAIGFLEMLGEPALDASAVTARWSAATRHDPVAILGLGTQGLVTADLRSGHAGPNAFLAGTVGSGKSDFLRAFLVSLALANPPDALNFVLVDFKEGSGLDVLRRLPHTAAILTNHDRDQLERILVSLSAERERRQSLVKDAGFDNFDDYQRAPNDPAVSTLPRLIIVVDEFAALREAMPESIARLVDIVRRGRSAGMHLLLATQTVSTSVGQDIADNTTLHICLRVESEAESRAVLGSAAAANIMPSMRGRGFAEVAGELRQFQTGWLGARTAAPGQSAAVKVASFALAQPAMAGTSASPVDITATDTDFAVIALALDSAAAAMAISPAVPPWAPPLPTVVSIDKLAVSRSNAVTCAWGLLDLPHRGRHEPLVVDLSAAGHVLVVGGRRSGRTSVLRTVAANLAAVTRPEELHLYAIEGAGRALGALAELPHTGAVVTADDDERLQRLLRVLLAMVDRRQRLLAEAACASMSELRTKLGADTPADVVILVDGFESIRDAGLEGDRTVIDALTILLREGPPGGMHLVIATDPSVGHNRTVNSIGTRLVLGLPESTDYAQYGIERKSVPSAGFPPGRGIWTDSGDVVQIALLDADTAGAAQNRAVSAIASAAQPATAGRGPQVVRAHHTRLQLGDLVRAAPTEGLAVALGEGGDGPDPVVVDLGSLTPGFVIAGGRGSGRTQVLRSLLAQLTDGATGRPPVIVVTAKPAPASSLKALAQERGVLAVLDDDGLPEALRLLSAATTACVVLIDDADRLLEGSHAAALESAVVLATQRGHVVVVAGLAGDFASHGSRWLHALRRRRNGILLSLTSKLDGQAVGVSLLNSRLGHMPQGRGLLVLDGQWATIQLPTSE